MNRRPGSGSPDAGQVIFRDAGNGVPPATHAPGIPDNREVKALQVSKRDVQKAGARKEPVVLRDMLYTARLDGACHIISEDYSYKSDTYYTILRQEMEGRMVKPSSAAVLDAYVVPICLERAHRAGIPVCAWGISQGYAPLPSLVYGLNYFASSADYAVIHDSEKGKEIIKHITNKGKYPFCFQKLNEGAEVATTVAIFGKTTDTGPGCAELARRVYDLFAIPLVTIVFVRYGGSCCLSSLSPTRYSRLSAAERTLIAAYISHQEFL